MSHENEYTVVVQRVSGDTLIVRSKKSWQPVGTPRVKVSVLKNEIAEITGTAPHTQELYLLTAREGEGKQKLLGNQDEVTANSTVLMAQNDAFCWDSKNCKVVNDDKTVAIPLRDCGIQSKEAVKPNSGVHRFEFVIRLAEAEAENLEVEARWQHSNPMIGLSGATGGAFGLWRRGRFQFGESETRPCIEIGTRFGMEIDTNDGMLRFYQDEQVMAVQMKNLRDDAGEEPLRQAEIKHVPMGIELKVVALNMPPGVSIAISSTTSGVFPFV